MVFFILSTLSVLITAFLIMTAVQLIRIERIISDATDLTEVHVKKLYRKI